jgi:hypothetical protein
MKLDIALDRGAMLTILKSEDMAAALLDAADDIAGNLAFIDTHSGDVVVDTDTHEAKLSAAASVTIVHPGAGALEAKHGYLAKAASAAGYPLKAR